MPVTGNYIKVQHVIALLENICGKGKNVQLPHRSTVGETKCIVVKFFFKSFLPTLQVFAELICHMHCENVWKLLLHKTAFSCAHCHVERRNSRFHATGNIAYRNINCSICLRHLDVCKASLTYALYLANIYHALNDRVSHIFFLWIYFALFYLNSLRTCCILQITMSQLAD